MTSLPPSSELETLDLQELAETYLDLWQDYYIPEQGLISLVQIALQGFSPLLEPPAVPPTEDAA